MARRRYAHRIPQLDDDAYYAKLEEQSGGCAICDRLPRSRRLAGDHNHATGKRRGLLCYPCNRYVIGILERLGIDPERIAAYFRQYPD